MNHFSHHLVLNSNPVVESSEDLIAVTSNIFYTSITLLNESGLEPSLLVTVLDKFEDLPTTL